MLGRKSIKRRWCEIRVDDTVSAGELSGREFRYSVAPERKPLGLIDMYECLEVAEIANEQTTECAYSFSVTTAHRKYIFFAETALEQSSWVRCLTAAKNFVERSGAKAKVNPLFNSGDSSSDSDIDSDEPTGFSDLVTDDEEEGTYVNDSRLKKQAPKNNERSRRASMLLINSTKSPLTKVFKTPVVPFGVALSYAARATESDFSKTADKGLNFASQLVKNGRSVGLTTGEVAVVNIYSQNEPITFYKVSSSDN